MTRGNTFVLAVLGVALTAAAVGGQAPDPKLISSGRQLFNSKKYDCVKCHSAEGKGNKKLPMEKIKATPEEVRKWITSPAEMTAKLPKKPGVPMKKQNLSPVEVDQVVAYLLSIQ